MAISDLIKTIRTEANDSPAAAAAKTGVSRPGYLKWESGDTANMKLAHLVKFCDAYRVSIEPLIRGSIVYLEKKPPAQASTSAGMGVNEPDNGYHPTTQNPIWVAKDANERALLEAWRNRDPISEAVFKTLMGVSEKIEDVGT